MDLQINVARPERAEDIAQLVNAAYRPGTGTRGWTHESALVSGPRTEVSQVREAMQQPGSAILVARSGSTILACVQLEREGEICHLGMLAVDPALQGSGLGKTLMSYAERHALEQMKCSTIRISVLSRRPELIAFYVRRGFRQTGTVTPYPIAAGVGTPIVDGLSLDTLEKSLSFLHATQEHLMHTRRGSRNAAKLAAFSDSPSTVRSYESGPSEGWAISDECPKCLGTF